MFVLLAQATSPSSRCSARAAPDAAAAGETRRDVTQPKAVDLVAAPLRFWARPEDVTSCPKVNQKGFDWRMCLNALLYGVLFFFTQAVLLMRKVSDL